jgi:hypothetical protein
MWWRSFQNKFSKKPGILQFLILIFFHFGEILHTKKHWWGVMMETCDMNDWKTSNMKCSNFSFKNTSINISIV